MRINPKEFKNGVIFYLNEDISVDTVKFLQEMVEPFLNKKVKNVLFDFSGAEYICSAGLGIVANTFKKLSEYGGKVYVTNINKQVERVLHTTTLDQFVIIRPDSEEIIRNLEASIQ